MKTIYNKVRTMGRLEDLLIRSDQISEHLPRHQSISRNAISKFPHLSEEEIYVMDSSPAVILGAYQGKDQELVINIGNGHSLGVYFEHSVVKAIYETHTGGVTAEKFEREIFDVLKGELNHKKALDRGGHGVFLDGDFALDDSELKSLRPYTVIGPNRDKVKELQCEFVHPGGNMMLAGPIGLIKAFESSIVLT